VGAIDAVLLDIDGVLALSWEPLPGASETVRWLRGQGVAFRLITNTTTHTRRELAQTLTEAGIEVRPDEIVTAVVATASFLRSHHAGAKVYVLSDGDARDDLEDVALTDTVEAADVVVLGGACDDFSYVAMNRIFRTLMGGATLVGMHRNLYWKTNEGWQLDGGAYIAGLEEATRRSATICGKPSAAYFEEVLGMLGVPAGRAAMVGDDVTNDVLGAQAVGITGVLVRTGKYRPEDLAHAAGVPDHQLDSIAGLPSWVASA
jgi:HAD superfamily hydrolase (TIGR01458 family)